MADFNLTHAALKERRLPAYFYSQKALSRQYQALKATLPTGFQIFFSLKANSNPHVVQCLQKLGALADVASENELRLALSCGYQGPQIEFTGPGKSESALALALSSRVGTLIVESLQELHLINRLCDDLNTRSSVAVRINPAQSYLANGRVSQAPSSQFGVDEEQLIPFFKALDSCPHVDLAGVHLFSQSQLLSADAILGNFSVSMDSALNAARLAGRAFRSVNLGGGFGIPYFQGERPIDLAVIRDGLQALEARARKTQELRETQFFVESGRFLAGPCGTYVAQVLFTKTSRGKKFAVLNGGFSHNMAACGFGQFLRRNYLISSVHPLRPGQVETVSLVGPSCYSLDTLATDLELPTLSPGDFICVANSGSYGATFSPHRFLLFEPVAEYFLEDL